MTTTQANFKHQPPRATALTANTSRGRTTRSEETHSAPLERSTRSLHASQPTNPNTQTPSQTTRMWRQTPTATGSHQREKRRVAAKRSTFKMLKLTFSQSKSKKKQAHPRSAAQHQAPRRAAEEERSQGLKNEMQASYERTVSSGRDCSASGEDDSGESGANSV